MNSFLFGKCRRKVEFIARLGIMIALTLVFQYISGLAKIQLLTGSVVNMFLILSVLLCGLVGGSIVSLITPFIGFMLGFSGNIVLVPFIAVSNVIYVCVFALLIKAFSVTFEKESSSLLKVVLGVLSYVIAAGAKFLFLTLFALRLILPLIMGTVPPPVFVSFGVLQLFTAIIGGTVAYIVGYLIKKAELF